jgi:CheY-like chemotaxis protein
MAVPAHQLFAHPGLQRTFTESERLKTLVVDDSPIFTELACSVLEQHPAIELIGTAQDGVEAIKTGLLLHPGLIVMDIHMPRLDGLAATTLLMGSLPIARIILMSSENSSYLRAECRQRGAVAFVPKLGFTEEIRAVLEILQIDPMMQEGHS